MYEIEKGTINPPANYQYKFININCGYYSYAEIPNLYTYILGVSGTLKCLSTKEKNKIIIEKYEINLFTYSPTVYGKYALTYNE